MLTLKAQLYTFCGNYLKNKEAEIKRVIEEAREAANNDTKSSAGDKYETGREVMQQEIDLNLTRLNELNKMKQAFERIIHDLETETAQPGSIVCTSNSNYYIAVSAGQVKVDDVTYYLISAASPIGAQLIGQKAGYQFSLNGKTHKIISVE